MKILTHTFLFPFLALFLLAGCERKEETGGTEQDTDVEMTYFLAVEEMPRIIGGIQSVQQKIRYPELAIRAGIEGTVFVFAFVDTMGNVVKTEIVQDPGAGLGDAAADAVRRTQFTPGYQRGRPVPTRVSIPVHFRLSKGDTESERADIRIIEGPAALSQTIRYPGEAISREVEGRVHVSVRLDEHARIRSVSLVEGIGYGCDEAVLEAVVRYRFYEDELYISPATPSEFPVIVQFSIK